MKLVSVVLDIPTKALDAAYTYVWFESEHECAAWSSHAVSQVVSQASLEDYLESVQCDDGLKDALAHQSLEGQRWGNTEMSEVEECGQAPDGAECDTSAFGLDIGCAVLVPFGHRPAVGFVVDIQSCDGVDGIESIKPIDRVISKPFFTDIGARCAAFMAERYIAPFSTSIRLCMPPGGVPRIERIDGRWELTKPLVHEVDERWVSRTDLADSFTPRKGAIKQQQILRALEQGDLRVSELSAEYGSVSSTIGSLEKKGIITIETRRRVRTSESVSDAFKASQAGLSLTPDQKNALETIEAAAQKRAGHVVLVDGVTGSGKTEVYLCAIEQVLKEGRGAIVLVPEISLTPQTVARFRGRFGETVAVLHSRMSQGERFDQWDAIQSGAARVVVGARSALFAPMKQVGIIIIDEEHESSYKQDQAPRYVTRDVAQWLAQAHGAVLVLGSATPSLEALASCDEDERWHYVAMPHRANGRPLPAITVVDMAREFGGGNRSMFSRELQTALFDVVDRREKAVLLLNQRGFAQFLLCRDCGYVPSCDSCSTSLTYHEKVGKLICHYCGYETPVLATCPKCGSPYLKRFGAGTQRVESELVSLLEGRDCAVIRMDADTTVRKGDHQRLLEAFAAPGSAVLLGTQMIAKGLDFDDVTLVGVINADTMLKLPDFRSAERTFDLIEQVAGRAGRAEKPGHVIVQTYSAQDPAIKAAARYNREMFLTTERPLRRGLGYPPFVRLANILIWGKDEERVKCVAHEVYAELRPLILNASDVLDAKSASDHHGASRDRSSCDANGAFDAGGAIDTTAHSEASTPSPAEQSWVILPPTPCVLERLKGSWRYHIVLKAPKHVDIARYVGAYFRGRKPDKDVRVSIDIDPINLL